MAREITARRAQHSGNPHLKSRFCAILMYDMHDWYGVTGLGREITARRAQQGAAQGAHQGGAHTAWARDALSQLKQVRCYPQRSLVSFVTLELLAEKLVCSAIHTR